MEQKKTVDITIHPLEDEHLKGIAQRLPPEEQRGKILAWRVIILGCIIFWVVVVYLSNEL